MSMKAEVSPMIGMRDEMPAASAVAQTIAVGFSERGLSRAVRAEAEEQLRRERETQDMYPEAYRLSRLPEVVINGKYRRGSTEMGSAGLCAYFEEVRARRTRTESFDTLPASDEMILSGEADKLCTHAVRGGEIKTLSERFTRLPRQLRTLPARAKERIVLSSPSWFDTARSNTDRESRRFPLSAFAAVFAVAISLMLIVASSVMVHSGEKSLNALTMEMEAVGREVAEMRSDLSAGTDLLGVREIAVREYGMVSEEYLRMHYLNTETSDSVELYEEEREETVGLGALLSAIGIK